MALGALDGRIHQFRGELERFPSNRDTRRRLVNALLLRSGAIDRYADLDEARELVGQGLDERRASTWLLRARTEAAIHDFAAARSALRTAIDLDASHPDITELALSIDLAQGSEPVALMRRATAWADREPGAASEALAALSLVKAGHYEEADRRFSAALNDYQGVSPFPVARLAFERGLMWSERADRPERGMFHYRESIRRLGSTRARVHGAEILADRGDVQAALALLDGVHELSDSPEPWALRATLLSEADPDTSRRLLRQAASRYASLMERYPLAVCDHAAEFYLGVGDDPERAVRAAEIDASNRPGPETRARLEQALRARGG